MSTPETQRAAQELGGAIHLLCRDQAPSVVLVALTVQLGHALACSAAVTGRSLERLSAAATHAVLQAAISHLLRIADEATSIRLAREVPLPADHSLH